MGLFKDKSGRQDYLYEDKEVEIHAVKNGYILEEVEWRKRHYPKNEDELLDLIDELHLENRKKIAKIVHRHAHENPRYRAKRKSRSRDDDDDDNQKTGNNGCGCLVFFLVAAFIGFLLAGGNI